MFDEAERADVGTHLTRQPEFEEEFVERGPDRRVLNEVPLERALECGADRAKVRMVAFG